MVRIKKDDIVKIISADSSSGAAAGGADGRGQAASPAHGRPFL